MTKRAGAVLLLVAAAVFLLVNRAAYDGFFQDDELVNIGWPRHLPAVEYLKATVSPRFFEHNFRPVGFYYFHEMSRRFALDFPKYLPILHFAHILNIWLVWILARRLGFEAAQATLGTVFFALHVASFDIYWKPMYVFDLFCATFSLASIVFYTGRRYVLSFCAFWLAYRSKELAVMLPAALLCYEFWIAREKRWLPLIPFFAASLSFGIQGLLMNPNKDNDYTFRFTPLAFATSLRYYSSQILLLPYAGLALAPLPFVVRDRRLWFGLAILCLFFFPLMFLPGRLFAAYCYLPLAGLALIAAALAARKALAPAVAVAALAWIPWNWAAIVRTGYQTLARDEEYRAYVSALADFAKVSKDTRVFVYEGRPTAFNVWGIDGALYHLFGRSPELYSIEDKAGVEALQRPGVALLQWNPDRRALLIRAREAEIPYLAMNQPAPLWQFGDGWYSLEDGFRWSSPQAAATLARPPGAKQFELIVNVSPQQLESAGRIGVAVALDGVEIGKGEFTAAGIQTSRWPVPGSTASRVNVGLRVTPEYRPTNGDTRRLGVAVIGLGFR